MKTNKEYKTYNAISPRGVITSYWSVIKVAVQADRYELIFVASDGTHNRVYIPAEYILVEVDVEKVPSLRSKYFHKEYK